MSFVLIKSKLTWDPPKVYGSTSTRRPNSSGSSGSSALSRFEFAPHGDSLYTYCEFGERLPRPHVTWRYAAGNDRAQTYQHLETKVPKSVPKAGLAIVTRCNVGQHLKPWFQRCRHHDVCLSLTESRRHSLQALLSNMTGAGPCRRRSLDLQSAVGLQNRL